MSRDASITLDWPDGERVYRLRIGELRALQEKCDAGPMVVLRRLVDGAWRVDDVTETIRLGAIGGGAKLDEARAIVRDSVELRPLAESVPYARAILAAAIVGVEQEPIEEAPAGKADAGKPRRTRAGSSASRSSTETALSSAGPQPRSTS